MVLREERGWSKSEFIQIVKYSHSASSCTWSASALIWDGSSLVFSSPSQDPDRAWPNMSSSLVEPNNLSLKLLNNCDFIHILAGKNRSSSSFGLIYFELEPRLEPSSINVRPFWSHVTSLFFPYKVICKLFIRSFAYYQRSQNCCFSIFNQMFFDGIWL